MGAGVWNLAAAIQAARPKRQLLLYARLDREQSSHSKVRCSLLYHLAHRRPEHQPRRCLKKTFTASLLGAIKPICVPLSMVAVWLLNGVHTRAFRILFATGDRA